MKEPFEYQKVSLDMPIRLYKKLKIYCVNNDMKMREVMIEAIMGIVNQRGK